VIDLKNKEARRASLFLSLTVKEALASLIKMSYDVYGGRRFKLRKLFELP
jgi:hypothetical protein